jgi:alkaline phosphatase
MLSKHNPFGSLLSWSASDADLERRGCLLRGTRGGLWSRHQTALAAAVVFAIVLAVVLASASMVERGEAKKKPGGSAGKAKSAIFMMGDGMGQAHRDAIQLATVGAYDRLEMDKLPVEGMVGTNAADPRTFVTDSAAGATSFASGVKTYNGAIGVDQDGEVVPTIIERAKAAGKSVGLVTTAQVTDASPAAFAAHAEDRGQGSEIARQYIEETKVDVILGGGEDYWYPEGVEGAFPDNPPEEESQGTEGNLVERAKELGYEYVTDQERLEGANDSKVLGLFANEEMFQHNPEGQGDVYEPTVPLPVMTQKAIELLSRNPQGFFLFVEEEAIDQMSHSNNAPLLIKSGEALDEAVATSRTFTDSDEKTLLIVTADHECGGLTIERPSNPRNPDESGGNEGNPNANLSVEDGPFAVADSDYQFIMDWTTTGHTAVDVPLMAEGPGAGRLTGNYENTKVYDVMAKTLGVAKKRPGGGTPPPEEPPPGETTGGETTGG